MNTLLCSRYVLITAQIRSINHTELDKLPINNDCLNNNSLLANLNVALRAEMARDRCVHVKKTLPPSLNGFPGEAEIRYFVKVTVVRPQLWKENRRSVRKQCRSKEGKLLIKARWSTSPFCQLSLPGRQIPSVNPSPVVNTNLQEASPQRLRRRVCFPAHRALPQSRWLLRKTLPGSILKAVYQILQLLHVISHYHCAYLSSVSMQDQE